MTRITDFRALQPESFRNKNQDKIRQSRQNPDLVDSFNSVMKKELHKVNALQQYSDRMTEKLATGEVDNVHDVMIAAAKAKVSMELTLEVRNKMIEAYREIIRMQV